MTQTSHLLCCYLSVSLSFTQILIFISFCQQSPVFQLTLASVTFHLFQSVLSRAHILSNSLRSFSIWTEGFYYIVWHGHTCHTFNNILCQIVTMRWRKSIIGALFEVLYSGAALPVYLRISMHTLRPCIYYFYSRQTTTIRLCGCKPYQKVFFIGSTQQPAFVLISLIGSYFDSNQLWRGTKEKIKK